MLMNLSPNLFDDLDDQKKDELEKFFQNLELNEIEEYEKIVPYQTKVIKTTIKNSEKETEFKHFKVEVVDLGAAVKNREHYDSGQKRQDNEKEIEDLIPVITLAPIIKGSAIALPAFFAAAGAFLAGFGIWSLWKRSKEQKEYKDYMKIAEEMASSMSE